MKKIIAALILSLVLLPACDGLAKTLKMSSLGPQGGIEAEILENSFIKYITEKSGGKYTFDVYYGGSLGNTETVVQGLLMGTIDIALESASTMDQFAKGLGMLELPFVLPNGAISRLDQSAIAERIHKLGEKTDIYIFGVNTGFPRNYIARKPMKTFEEMQNAKSRTTGGKWHLAGTRAMGLNPIPMPAAEMLTGIQQGVVDCMDVNIPAMIQFRIYDVAKHVILMNQPQMATLFACSNEFWDDLPDADKKIFLEASHNYNKAMTQAVEEITARLVDELKQAGCEVYELPEAEVKKFQEKVQQELAREFTPEEMNLLKDIQTALQ